MRILGAGLIQYLKGGYFVNRTKGIKKLELLLVAVLLVCSLL
jgi:hypothetical protein